MKLLSIILLSLLLLILPVKTDAQGMMGNVGNSSTLDSASVTSTAQDEANGKILYEKLQNKQVTCTELTDDDFDVLGDYFMGQRLGNTESHALMNDMMKRMMGDDGEKQMHISLGKRLSNCNSSAPISNDGTRFLPMLGLGGMMGSNGNSGYSGGMMGYGFNGFGQKGWNILGIIPWTLGILFLILGILYFWRGIHNKK
jgi:hypothetical protein